MNRNEALELIRSHVKEKRFAAGANRDQIKSCENSGLSLEEFISISLKGMKEIDKEIGL